ncbi:hypothetical protein [Comamonas sp.]|uniref:hypothetical protein n=1 Tax=Comamonas sp. TaxID=34028 RepID=UPI0028AF7573|nr:hypothetical protein [Comamonas sp.]
MNDKADVFAEEVVSETTHKVEQVWGEVFRLTDRLVKAHHRFGFSDIKENVSPTIEDMLESLRFLESILDRVASKIDSPECMRMILNAKQAILNIEEVSLALSSQDVGAYQTAMQRLNTQAPF